MSILFHIRIGPAEPWTDGLRAEMPGEDIRLWPDAGDPAAVEFAVTWRHPAGLFQQFPNLKGIFSIGAGVDHILCDPDLPPGVPVIRLVDPVLDGDMTLHVVHRVIHYHRGYHRYPDLQRAARWEKVPFPESGERRIGVMGLGRLGGRAATTLASLGFAVAGWSRTAKAIPGLACFAGDAQLPAFLARSQILVCLLSLTPETANIVDRNVLQQLPQGAFVINTARGGHVVEPDLIAALDSGHIERANLDVFAAEPLPPDSPLWHHPGIDVTPHVAARVNPRSACRIFAAGMRHLRAGQSHPDTIDRARGY